MDERRVELRRYQDSDEAFVKPWFEHPSAAWLLGLEWLDSALRNIREKPARHALFVGWADDERISVISVSRVRDHFDHIVESIMVRPDLQGRGWGSASAEAVLDLDDYDNVEIVMGFIEHANVDSVKLAKGLGPITTHEFDKGKAVFAGRRDGQRLPLGWEPPPVIP
jgi:L-amino acid N-acyltransferase YncA